MFIWRVFKRVLKVFGLLVLFVVVWYGQSRLFSPLRSITVKAGAAPVASQLQNGELQVGAYNIAHGRGKEMGRSNWTGASADEVQEHLGLIANQVSAEQFDLLVLNECDFNCSWSKGIDQAQWIADNAGFVYVAKQRIVDASLPFRSYRFGNALLSRYPITETRFIRLPLLSKKEAFFAGNHDSMLATVETPQGPVRILVCHLEARSEVIRVAAAKLLRGIIAEEDTPCLVIGDLNSAPSFAVGHYTTDVGENAVDILVQGGLLSAGPSATDWKQYLTFSSEKPDRAIDWILATPNVQLDSPQVVPSLLSDHRMIKNAARLTYDP